MTCPCLLTGVRIDHDVASILFATSADCARFTSFVELYKLSGFADGEDDYWIEPGSDASTVLDPCSGFPDARRVLEMRRLEKMAKCVLKGQGIEPDVPHYVSPSSGSQDDAAAFNWLYLNPVR